MKKDNKPITPELAGGFKDYLPEDMIPRQKMFDSIRKTFELFGFLPLDTPGIEKERILTGGDADFKMMMFKTSLKDDEEENLALRFDLTVPLARVMALYTDKIEKPFKRYQTGKVWRGEKPQAGRFREFVQFDADIVGTDRMSADSEIIALMYETLKNLQIERFLIKVNNRKILNGLPSFAGYDEKLNTEVLKSIDKLDKIGWAGVTKELTGKGFNNSQINKLEEFITLKGDSSENTLLRLEKMMADSPEAVEGIKELQEITANLKSLEVPSEFWQIDLSVARGLGYYTGPIFETTLLDLPSIGSVFSGGRYDDLVSRFGAQKLPAVGTSIGVDRLFYALEKLSLLKQERSNVKALVFNFDKSAEGYCQEIVTQLRKAGVPSEIYLGREEFLKEQLTYALKQEIPVVIIAGSDEMGKKVAQVKDIKKREQQEVLFDQITEFVKKILLTN